MSDQIISAIIALCGALFGCLITIFISYLNRKDKYLFTALDKKLEKHQEAFKLATGLPSAVHNSNKEEGREYIIKCHNWWNENCLYLEPNARKSFYNTVQTAYIYNDLLCGYRNNTISYENLHQNWIKIMNLPKIIEKGVNKPLISPTNIKQKLNEIGNETETLG